MIPRLEKIEFQNPYFLFQTTDGVSGIGARINSCDSESDEPAEYSERLSKWMGDLGVQLRARVIARGFDAKSVGAKFPRQSAIRRFKRFEHIVVVEHDPKSTLNGLVLPFKRGAGKKAEASSEPLLQTLSNLSNLGFSLSPLSEYETKELFIEDVSTWVQDIGSVETGTNSIGVIRLVRPSADKIDFHVVESVLSKLPTPFEIRVSIDRMSKTSTELFLQRRLRQQDRKSMRDDSVRESLEEMLQATTLGGESLMRYEFLVSLKRDSKVELRKALAEAATQLKLYGDIEIETIGCGPSFVSSLVGSQMHVNCLERNRILPAFLPNYRNGDANEFSGEPSRALSVLRLDDSATHIDLLDLNHQNGNAVIIGTSGRGKSVFLGSLTHSLLNDPSVSMIKVDVGGSHSRECSLMGGEEFKLSLSQPSGLNPFALVKLVPDFDSSKAETVGLGKESKSASHANAIAGCEFERSVLGQFLEVLILEEGETRLSKQVRSEIDQALEKYLSGRPSKPSLEDFVLSSQNLPRRSLFDRWVGKGIYANAFREKSGERGAGADSSSSAAGSFGSGTDEESAFTRERLMTRTRLRYLNFSEVFQATDQEFSTAAMAAVLAIFNLEMKVHPNRRLVLVCDETPFFINKCFEFFKFSTANVRKFGAAVVLTVQVSKHLIVGGDTAVIENSNHRFLFSHDGDEESFAERFQLSARSMDRLRNITRQKPSGFSQCLYQAGGPAKTIKLILSKEEYWRLTSTQKDRIKFDALMTAVPNLSVDEAIRCLSV